MKTLLISLLALNCIWVFGQTVNQPAPTTLEEYTYVTNGYKDHLEKGADMKMGYQMVSIDTVSTKIASAELNIFYQVKENKKEIAAYLIIYKRTGRTTEYICVPNPKSNKDIMLKYWTVLWDGSSETSSRGQLISYVLSKQLKW